MSFFSITALRTLLVTETDADSDIDEELMSQLRENFEALLMLFAYTGDSGSATSDPPNDTTGVLTDSGASYDTDEHNGRVLLITSGDAIGNMYQIDDVTGTTLVCTGDNLYADGVRSGNTYMVFYNLKNIEGHTHNAIDSAPIENPLGRTLAFSAGEVPATAFSTSYQDVLRIRFYIPTNPSTLTIGCVGWVSAASTGTLNVEVIDSGSTEFNSGTDTFTSTTDVTGQIVGPLSIDLSGAAPGWAHADFELKNSTTETSYIAGITAYWNT